MENKKNDEKALATINIEDSKNLLNISFGLGAYDGQDTPTNRAIIHEIGILLFSTGFFKNNISVGVYQRHISSEIQDMIDLAYENYKVSNLLRLPDEEEITNLLEQLEQKIVQIEEDYELDRLNALSLLNSQILEMFKPSNITLIPFCPSLPIKHQCKI